MSYMNLLNKLGKSDKMRGWQSILSLFATRLIKSIIQEHECKTRFYYYIPNVVMDVISFLKICKPLVVYRFYCMALFYFQTQRHKCMINNLLYSR